MDPHQLSLAQLIKKYGTNQATGLSEQEVAQKRAQYGINELPQKPAKSLLAIFLNQFQSPLIYILLIAAVIIFFVGEKTDTLVITGILFFNAIIGTFQEGKTLSLLESLRQFIISECVVIRDGKKIIIQDKDIVVGDIIILQNGNRVPADARIISANNIQIDEAILTGESLPVNKSPDDIDDDALLADRSNMVYKGTYILSGTGHAVVTAVGIHTEIGKIQLSAEKIHADMPLKKELNWLSYVILIGVFILCLAIFVIGLAKSIDITELFILITTLFISVVPEGLPVVLTLVLVRGAYHMAKKRVLIKRMQAVEALGHIQIIGIDKTGTLTRNEMLVTDVFTDNQWWTITGSGYQSEGDVLQDGQRITHIPSQLEMLGVAGSLLNNAEINYDPIKNITTIKGDPTEACLHIFSNKLGLSLKDLDREYKKLFEIPFDSHTKYHAAFFKKGNSGIAFVIGSPEVIMHFTQTDVTNQLTKLVSDGLRVVAIATHQFLLDQIPASSDAQASFFKDVLKNKLHFAGLIGMQDAIRLEVKPIIDHARSAGFHIIMITGDHKKTALHVAKEVGIFKEGDQAIEGKEFALLSEDELVRNLDRITVYSRFSPEDKLRIINIFQKLGKVVAMTGDGVNDAPSLVAADVGIAMGKIGTQVAQEASDLILLDDSFEYIITAIEQGRHIFYTLRRVILYFFSTNLGEVFLILCAVILQMPMPLLAAQILWLNLVTDGFLDVALAMEKPQKGLIYEHVSPDICLVDQSLIMQALFVSIPMALGAIWIFYISFAEGLDYARTMTLLTMAMFQWFNAWNCRSEKKSIFKLGLFSNRWLIIATLFVLFLQVCLIYVPWMQAIFKTVPLSIIDWTIVLIMTLPIIFIQELRKLVMRY